MSEKRMFLIVALLIAATSLVCLAQVEQGAISGAVLDSTGASIPKAKVTATNESTGTVATAETTDDGYYKIPYLPAGKYRVVVSLSGFMETTVDNVQVDAEQERGLEVTLQAGGVQETVTVTGGAQLLQTENGDVAGTLGTVEVQLHTDVDPSAFVARAERDPRRSFAQLAQQLVVAAVCLAKAFG